MTQPTRRRRPRRIAAVASLAFAFALTTCDQPAAGPGGRAALAVQVVMPASPDLTLFNLTIDNVRLVVVRPPTDTVFNQIFPFPANQTEIPLQADIPMQVSPETFRVTIELLSGTQVLFSGTQDISLSEGTDNPPAQLPVTYSGPGQNVATLTIGPVDSVLTQGGTLQFRLTAQDAQGANVPSFYASWTTSDTTIAQVDATGFLTAPLLRSTVSVQARTPGNASVSTPITFIPAPIAINIVSGCVQSGPPGAQLPQPIVARVIAGDGFGVKGIQVQFTAPVGGSVATPLVVTDDNGLAQTFATLPLQGPAVFSIGATGLSSVTCSQTVLGATRLVFTVQPSNIVAGTPIAVAITATDALGNPVTSFTGAVNLALGANPGGITFGTPSVDAVAGVTTFSNFTITKAAAGYTFVASSGSLTPATSVPFDVVPSAPAQLAFTVQPGALTVTQGVPIVPSPTVVIQDAFGNTTPTATGNVTIAIGANPGGSVLGGTPTQTAIAGVAAFPGLTLNQVGNGYTLVASSGNLGPATSAPFNVIAVTGLHLVFTTQPSNVTAGSFIAPPVVVTVQDGQNNTALAFTGDVTLSLGSCGTGALSGATTVPAVAGIATFADLSVDRSGPCILVASSAGMQSLVSAGFTVAAGAPALLAFTVQPSTVAVGAVISPVVQVAIEDGLGNTVPTATDDVTLAIGANPGNAILGGTLTKAASSGIALFTNLTLNQAGTGYTLVATSGTLTSATSTTFDVTAGAVTQLAVVVTPPSVTAGTPATIVVTAQDGSGATVTGYLGTVHFTSSDQQATLPLDYTFTTGDNGVHSFIGGATLRTQGTQAVTATDVVTSSITGTGSVSVTAGAAADLVFTVQPTAIAAGANFNPPLLVNAQDAFGNTATSFAGTVSLAIGTNPGGAVLLFTTAVDAAAGVASFDNVSLDKVGTGYTLVATSVSLNSAPSATFNVNAGAATQLAFVTQPGTVTQGAFIAPPVQVGIQDQFGNLVTTATNMVTVVLGANPGGATLGGGTPVAASAGIASFSNLTLSAPGSGYTLMASASGLGTVESAPFDITLVGATPNAWTTPGGGFWSVAANWSLGRVPQSSDSVVISLNGTYTVTLDTTISVAFLTFGASAGTQTLAMSTRTLTVTNAVTIQSGSIATVNNGTIAGSAALTNQGALTLGSATIGTAINNQGTLVATGASQVSGAVATGTTSTIRVEGNGIFGGAVLAVTGGSWTNNGAIVLTDVTSSYGAMLTVPNGTLTNAATGTIDAPLGTAGDRNLNAVLVNQGSLSVGVAAARRLTLTPPAGASFSNSATMTVNSGLLQITQSGTSPSFTNSGTIQLSGGSFSLNQPSGATPGTLGLTATGQIGIGTGRTFTVTGGAFTIPAGATVTGVGTLGLSGATANVTPNFNTGLTGLNLLNATWNGPGILTNPSGSTLNLQNSTIAAPFVNQGTLVATGGSSQLTGAVTTGTTSTIRVEGNGIFGGAVLTVTGGSWTNNGAIVLTDVTSSYGATLTMPNGTLTNAATGTIDAPLGTAGDRALNAALINQGTLTVGVAAARRLTMAPPAAATLANSNTITVNSGTLQMTQTGANPSFTNSGTIQLSGGDFALNQPSGATPGTLALTATGQVSIGTGRTVTVTGGVFTIPTGATVTGVGTLALSGAIANVTPNFNTGLTGLNLLNATWNGPGSLTNPSGTTLSLQNSTIAAPFVNQGTLVATGGSSQLTGAVTTGTTSTIRVEGNGIFGGAVLAVTGGSWTNNGAIVLTDVTSSYGATLTVPNGTLTNAATGTIDAPLGTAGDRALNAALTNQGMLTVGVAAARRLTMAPPAAAALANSATITVNSGTLQVTQTGTSPSLSNSGTIQLTGGDFSLNQPSGATPGTLALTATGQVSIGSGRTFSVTGGVFTIPTGATVTGTGTLALSGATANVTPNFNTGLTGLNLLNSTWNGPGILTNPSGTTLNLQNSTITAPFVNQGTLLATGGSSQLTGTVTTGTTSTIRVEGNGIFGGAVLAVTGGSWTNNGAIVLTDVTSSYGATLTVPNGTLTNAATGTIDAPLGTAGDRALNAALTNQGMLTVGVAAARRLTMSPPAGATLANSNTITVNSGTLQITQTGTSPSFTNSGAIQLSGGSFELNQPSGVTPGTLVLASTGSITIGTGRTVTVTGGIFNINNGATLTGGGTLALSGTTANVTPSFSTGVVGLSLLNSIWNGSTTLTNASGVTLGLQNSTIAAPFVNQGTLVATGGSSQLTGAVTTGATSTIRVEGNGIFGGAVLAVTGGSWTNNGAIVLTDVTSSYGATLTVPNGTLTNAATGAIDAPLGTAGDRALNAGLINQGTLTVGVAAARNLTMNPPAGATLSNSSTITVSGGTLQITESGTDPAFTNSGLIQLSGGDLTVVLGGTRPAFSNTSTGVIDVGTRKLTINNQSTGSFTNAAGGTLRGSGTIDIGTASFITNGITTVGGASPGTLTFVGPYLQGPTPSIMNVRIGGDPTKPGVDYDQLLVTGANGSANLQGGILNVTVGQTQPGSYVIIQLPAGKTFTGNFGQISFSANCDLSPTGPVGNQYLLTCQ